MMQLTKSGKVRAYLYKRDGLPGRCTQIIGGGGGWQTLCLSPATFGRTCFDHSLVCEIHDFLEGVCAFITWVQGRTGP